MTGSEAEAPARTPARPGPAAALLGSVRRVLGLVLQLLLLWAALEATLMLLGVEGEAVRNADVLGYQVLRHPAFVADEEAGVFRAAEPRLGSRTFALAKPEGALRVVCLGGSALRGLGYSPNVSVPGWLERMLAHAAPEGRRCEVLNLGLVGIASREVRELCEEALGRYDPDLVVVATGNNEFLDVHARRYRERTEPAWLVRAGDLLRRLRTYHLARRWSGAEDDAGGPAAGEREALQLTATEIVRRVRLEPADVARVHARHRANLEAMAAACEAAGVPLVLMTVPANLRWNDPFPGEDWIAAARADAELGLPAVPPGAGEAGGPGDGAAGEEAPVRALLAAVREREASATADGADEAGGSERARKLACLRGKCLERLGELALARAAYAEALDLDAHRRSASTAMNAAVRDVAASSGALLADTAAALAEAEAIPDGRFFYDHIHFTPEGARYVAAWLLERLVAEGVLEGGVEADEAARAAFADALRAELAARIASGEDYAERELWIGFDDEPELVVDPDLWKYDRAVRGLEERLAAGAELAPQTRGRLLTWLGNARSFERGGGGEARRCYDAAMELVPTWRPALRRNLAALEE